MESTSSDKSSQWPYTAMGGSAGSADTLLCAILAAGRLDEISTAEGAVERYLLHLGHADESGRLQSGVVFWVYPTGGKGPYEDLEDGTILKHGLLLTVEPGALVKEAAKTAEAALPATGIAHAYVGKAG